MEMNHVLVVEDDKEIREGVEIYLKSQGYEVFQAGLKACGYIEDQEIKKIAWNSDMCCAR